MIIDKLKTVLKILTFSSSPRDWKKALYVSVKDHPLNPNLNMNLKLTDIPDDEKENVAEFIYYICTNWETAKHQRTSKMFLEYLEKKK